MRAALAMKGGAVLALVPLLGCWLLASSLWAGEARLVAGSGPDRVVVETNDASVEEVLTVLARHFEFAVVHDGSSGQAVRFSGRIEGSLDEVLSRLLRHQGHMIVRSTAASAGISRVVLLEAKGKAPAPSMAGPIASLKARLGLKESEKAPK